MPTFAFVNGAALGGGLEVALHCAYRTVSSAPPRSRLPEVFLGLVPGWGGTSLLPNLIGADKAVKVIIENPLNQNKTLRARRPTSSGIADAMFEAADFLEQSLLWAARVLTGEVTVERPEVDRGEAWDQAVATRPGRRGRQGARGRPRRRTGRSTSSPRPGPHSRDRASPPRTRRSPT